VEVFETWVPNLHIATPPHSNGQRKLQGSDSKGGKTNSPPNERGGKWDMCLRMNRTCSILANNLWDEEITGYLTIFYMVASVIFVSLW
jgi:hypothetical protein